MRSKGINGEHTKQQNRLLVLRLLCTMREATRTEITRRVGLAKMTVSNITAELLESGVIYEKETLAAVRPGAGRKQMLLSLSQELPVAVGVWLSRDFCLGIAATMDLQVLSQRLISFTAEETSASITKKAVELVRTLQASTGRRMIGVGVASIGPLDPREGILLNPPNFYQIHDYGIAEQLRGQLECPVFLQNDANAGALAEKYFGCCQDFQNFAYIGIANGVGAGLVVNDSLYDGTGGFAGEIGHMVIDFEGPVCHCGRKGCLETFVSVPKVLESFEKVFGHSFGTLSEVCGYCEESERGAALLQKLLGSLAVGLINLGNLTAPEAIVIGHEGAVLSDLQLGWIAEQVNCGVLARGAMETKVLRSSFGTLAPVYGAAVTVLKQVFEGKLLYEELFAGA